MERNRNAGTPRQPFRHEGHKRPVTRRDFLAQGFLSGAAFVALPSLASLLGRPGSALGQTPPPSCNVATGGGKIPFVCFDLGGGASVAGSNVLVGGPLGQLDPLTEDGYIKLGLPTDMHPQLPGQINTELGLAFHADSAFLRGILDKTTPETRVNVNGCVVCARSENDTGNNPHNPMYGISMAGASGDLAGLVGTRSSDSGGKSGSPMSMIDLSVRPVKVDRPADVTGLVDTGKLVEILDAADAQRVMEAVEQLSDDKLVKMDANQDAILAELIRCGYIESTNLVATFGDPTLLDPLNDAQLTSILSAAEISNDSEFRKTASIMKLVMNGHAGAGTLEFGGYDYHNSTRATGENKDFIAGQAMGAVLEYARLRGQQVMVYVFSDGSVSSNGQFDNDPDGRGKLIWKSDNSGTAATFMLVYDPAGPPPLTTPAAQQLGYFRASGSVETGATRVSNNVDQLVEAVVLNYMALHDEVSDFETVLPDHGLGSAAEIDSLIAFQPIRPATP